jgi:pilus assembly protein CpaC
VLIESKSRPVFKLSSALCAIVLFATAPIAVAQQSGETGAAGQASGNVSTPVNSSTPTPAPAAQSQSRPAAQESDQIASEPQPLHILVGRSVVISSPERIRRISLADPTVAEAIVVSPNQVLVNGKRPGGVSLLLWDEAHQSLAYDILVSIDIQSLAQKVHEVFPSEDVHVESANDAIILSGSVSSSSVADKIVEIVKGASPKVINMMDVSLPQNAEILLQVRFAEVDRTAIDQFGINWLSLPGSKNIGTISTQQFNPPSLAGSSGGSNGVQGSSLGVNDLLNVFIYRPDIDLAVTIKALQQQNILQILAEPNLVTESGKEASFLAGGEFPYPVPQIGTGGAGSTITIQFKEYGIRLNFTPVYTSDGIIHLKVKPEVSSLDYTNAVTLQGFFIPAISTRRVESDMELRDGQSFAIAGLMDNTITNQMSKIPWIGDVPVLGKLFQSHSYNKNKTELLVVVTPRIIKPLMPEQVPHGPQFPVPFLDSEKPKSSGK